MNVTAIATAVMIAMLAAAVVSDVRTGKVPNKLTVPCAAVGLLLAALGAGLSGLGDRALGAAVALAAVVLLSTFVKLGGGDAKLLIAVGALKGWHFAVWALLLTAVAGGVLAIIMMLRQRALKQTAANLVANLLANASGVHTELAAGSAVSKLPYSIAIAAGAVAALLIVT